MSEYLTYEKFKWLKNVVEFGVTSVSEKIPIGYFLEVDLIYHDELHELNNDYPLAPKNRAVSSDLLSKYCEQNADKCEMWRWWCDEINPKFRRQK